MSISSLFNIGLTGLQSTTQLLNITAHNIANQNTPGYSCQEATVQAIPSALITSTGTSGNGVQITDIQRAYNSFVASQLNTENSNLSYWNNYQTGIAPVENVFNETSTTGISPVITTFFSDWQNVAQSPVDDAQRATLLTDANNLSSRLNSASASLQNERTQLLSDSQSLATQVNSDTAQIANLNAEIAASPGALDLQDQRDTLVQNLNSIIKVSTFSDNAGNLTVMIGGASLVQGTNTYQLSVNSDTANNMHFYVDLIPGATQGSAENPDVTSSVTGGQLKANYDLRDTQIPSYLNQLNAFAIDLADTTNYYQKQGYDLNGMQGGNFFQLLTAQARYNSNSLGSGTSDGSNANGVFTSPTLQFTKNGGQLTIKLGDNDTTPATFNVAAGATLNDVVNDINSVAGSKVTASVVDLDPTGTHDYRISIKSNPDGNLGQVRIGVSTTDVAGEGLNLLANSLNSSAGGASTELSSVSVTNVNSLDSQAQYKVDYVDTAVANFGNVPNAFVINSTNSTIVFNDGGANKTATIAAGSYSASGLVTALKAALTAAGDANLNGAGTKYNASGQFVIANTGGAAQMFLAGSTATPEMFGFPSGSLSISGGGSQTSSAAYGAYQPEVNPPSTAAGVSTIFWRVQKSTDGSTWTTLDPNASYVSSNPATINESEVNLTPDYNQSSPSSSGYFTRTLEFEGIKVQIDGNGIGSNINPNGETFDVQLDPNAASDIKTVIDAPNKVAASTDMWAVNSTNNSVSFTATVGGVATQVTATIPTGSYTNDPTAGATDDISAALSTAIQTAYTNATGSTLPDTVNVVFNPNTKQFKIIKTNGTDPIQFQWGNSTAASLFGFSNGSSPTITNVGDSAVSDNPASVLLSANQGVPGDNRNATNIANLASGTFFGGTTPVDFYMSLVSNVGVDSASANNNQKYESNLVDQLTQRQSEVSGVSLDTEAANLVMYQKLYQASAQMITVANTLLTTLLQIVQPGSGGA